MKKTLFTIETGYETINMDVDSKLHDHFQALTEEEQVNIIEMMTFKMLEGK